jgi:hypothetical protein
MLDAAVKGAGFVGLLDCVLSVEDVGVYKLHPLTGSECRLLQEFPSLVVAH